MLKIIYLYCAGLDVHKKFVVVCLLSADQHGQVHKEMRTFSTMTADLEAMADWLAESQVTDVAMESSGVYWQPIFNILEGRFNLLLVNAQSIKRMPGRKTDMKDAEWIATLLQHGLLQASFIPGHQQRELRELTRYRQSLLQERSRFANRLQKVLEGTNLKLASVATDLQGVSAQAILRALLSGQEDPTVLAQMARGRMRSKQDELEQALVGKLTPHHRFMLNELLTHLDFLDQHLAMLETQIDEALSQMTPFQEAVRLLDTIPGVDRYLAILIVAEIGVDMSRFPSDRHITAWAGVAPGNNETGGKKRSGRVRQGNKYLQSGLVLAANAASRTKNCYLRALYSRLAARRGKNRAKMAVARTILQMAYHMLQRGESYRELGADYLDRLDRERSAKRLVKRLQALGFDVHVKDQETVAASTDNPTASASPLPLAV
jgi:transposase